MSKLTHDFSAVREKAANMNAMWRVHQVTKEPLSVLVRAFRSEGGGRRLNSLHFTNEMRARSTGPAPHYNMRG